MRVSAQLYTVRQVGDLKAQLELVAACGFTDVETVGFHDLSPQSVASLVQQSGLNVRSAHFDWEDFATRFDETLELLKLTECQVAVMPWLAPEARPDTPEGWMAVSGQLADWGAKLNSHGIRLAYHNHDFDLAGRAGETPLDLILSQDHVFWQPDIGWLAVSMPEPVELLARYADQIVSIHAKDAEPTAGDGDDRWRNLGHGIVDWDSVLRILEHSPCADLFVEHDETARHLETLVTGRNFLRQQLSMGAG